MTDRLKSVGGNLLPVLVAIALLVLIPTLLFGIVYALSYIGQFDIVERIVAEVLRPFAGFAMVYIPYLIARWFAERRIDKAGNERSARRVVLATTLVVAAVATFSWATYGTHTETGPDYDPVTGGDVETVEDFKPTSQQRNEHGLTEFLIFEIAVLFGTYKGLKLPAIK
jgi:hypothetical protein